MSKTETTEVMARDQIFPLKNHPLVKFLFDQAHAIRLNNGPVPDGTDFETEVVNRFNKVGAVLTLEFNDGAAIEFTNMASGPNVIAKFKPVTAKA